MIWFAILIAGAIIAGASLLAFWGTVVYWLSQWLEPAGHVEPPAGRAVADFGRVAALLSVAVVAICIIMFPLIDRSLGDFLLFAFAWPIFVIFGGLYFSSRFLSFAVLPLVGGIGLSLMATLAWTHFVAGRWRALWPIIAVLSFAVAMIALGRVEFNHDVVAAAARLGPDCVDSESFVAAVAGAGGRHFGLYASAGKGNEAYGWSFRARDFYKLPDDVKHNVFPRQGRHLIANYPSCWSAGVPLKPDPLSIMTSGSHHGGHRHE